MKKEDYEQLYRDGNPPWDHGSADHNLAEIVRSFAIKPCRTLDLGCGMGNNTVWLATNGFRVHSFDLSETAIMKAEQNTDAAGVSCTFQTGNFLMDHTEEAPFDFVFDRGCFHSIPNAKERKIFACNVAAVLEQDGRWLSLIGNADEPKRDIGPPQLSVREIAKAVELYFEIIYLADGFFGDDQTDPPRAWICLMKKRTPQ